MKKLVLSLTLAAGVLGLAACSSGNSETVVKSSAGDITKEEFYEAMKERVGEQVLQQLVIEKVLSKDYKVTDKELDKQLEEIKAEVGPQFPALLMQYGYKDEEDFRENLKLSLLQEKAAKKDVKITEKELKEYYETKQPDVKARHILVGPEDEAKAKEVKEKLNKGEDFAALAKEYSIDTVSAEQGGDLGFISMDAPNLDEQFKEAAFALNVDEISEPIETQFGWHIIQVTEKKEKEPYEKVKEQLEKELMATKVDVTKIEEAVKQELEKAKIKVEDKDLKATFDELLKDNANEEQDKADEDKKEETK